MAKCEKCSAEIAEGMNLCPECSNAQADTGDFWARPGSVANSGNSFVEKVAPAAPSVQSAPQPSAEEVAEPEQPKSVSTNNELDRRVKQTEYFNTIANVDEGEEEPDVYDLYPPTNLLEVPFRDTEYNIGYTIPKMKMVVSKQTRKKIAFSSLIVSCVALLIAGFILLDSMFGILPRVVDTPVMYIKSGNLFLTGTSGKRPENFAYEGNAFQISTGVQRVHFSPYSNDVFVIQNYNTKTGAYNLYVRSNGEVSTQGFKVDENVVGEFKYVLRGKSIIYLKGLSSYDLYIYNIESHESKRLMYSVTDFGLLDDQRIVVRTRMGDLKIANVASRGKGMVEEIAKDTESVYFDDEATKSFFFVKSLKNTETSEKVSELYRYANDKVEKVASNVDSVVAYSCADDWAYCTGENDYNLTVGDLINDDCEKTDRESTEGVSWEGGMSQEMARMVKRNLIRDRLFPMPVPLETFALTYYSKGEATEVSKYCTDIIFNGERKDDANKNWAELEQGAAVVYKEYIPGTTLFTFSELPDEMLSLNSFGSYASDYYDVLKNNVVYCAAVKNKASQLVYTAVKDNNISFSKNFDAIYYIDYVEKEDCGDLMQVRIDGKGFGSPEAIAVNSTVTEFYMLKNGTAVYVDSNNTIYAGGEALAHRISEYSVNSAADCVAVLAETIDVGSRLVVFKDGVKKAIDESVRSVCFNDDTTLSYIKEYDKVAGGGDFYICKNFNTSRRIDTGVSSLVKLK